MKILPLKMMILHQWIENPVVTNLGNKYTAMFDWV